jgi:hypothetical protein
MEETLISYIRNYCIEHKANNSLYDCVCDVIYEIANKTENWPRVPEDPDDKDSYMESVDLENLEIQKITENSIDIDAGGDRQDPWMIPIHYKDGKFFCVNARPSEDFNKGLSEEEMSEILDLDLNDFEEW